MYGSILAIKGGFMCVELKQRLRRYNISEEKQLLISMHDCANEVLSYFNIDLSTDVPIPIIKILQSAGLKVFKDKMENKNLSAFIAIDPRLQEIFGSDKIVCVNEDESLFHARFVLAHELAHFLFDYNEAENVKYYNTYMANCSSDRDFIEKRANKFAACLMMPEQQFRHSERKTFTEKGDRSATMVALSKEFSVPIEAVHKRFEELEIDGYEW